MPAPKKRGEPPPACEPAAYTDDDIRAVQALIAGVASKGQQQQAVEWIVHQAAKTHDLAYRPGGEDGRRETDFALGRAFVGQQILKMQLLRPKL